MQHAGSDRAGLVVVAGIRLAIAHPLRIHRCRERHVGGHTETAGLATTNEAIVADIDLPLRVGRQVGIQRHAPEGAPAVAALGVRIPRFLQQVRPHPPALVRRQRRPQVGMDGRPGIAVNAQAQRVGTGGARPFLREAEDPRSRGRSVQRTRHTVQHLDTLELLGGVVGGADHVEAVDPAVLNHAALHAACLRPDRVGLHPGQVTQRILHAVVLIIGHLLGTHD